LPHFFSALRQDGSKSLLPENSTDIFHAVNFGRYVKPCTRNGNRLRIPMMSISHSDLMPISSERSDAEPSQCETVIDMSQDFVCIS